mmetsp:Transcript_13534/g.37531  ORF Transcript_13534/g.37531 Transcript_13534/m.37531 type:complete len:217 (-) Transcript_13534:1028-1678(-)
MDDVVVVEIDLTIAVLVRHLSLQPLQAPPPVHGVDEAVAPGEVFTHGPWPTLSQAREFRLGIGAVLACAARHWLCRVRLQIKPSTQPRCCWQLLLTLPSLLPRSLLFQSARLRFLLRGACLYQLRRTNLRPMINILLECFGCNWSFRWQPGHLWHWPQQVCTKVLPNGAARALELQQSNARLVIQLDTHSPQMPVTFERHELRPQPQALCLLLQCA